MAPRSIGRRHASALETLSITVEEPFVPLFEQALMCACETVGIFEADDAQKYWRVEGVKDTGFKEDELENALAVARMLTGCEGSLNAPRPSPKAGWPGRMSPFRSRMSASASPFVALIFMARPISPA